MSPFGIKSVRSGNYRIDACIEPAMESVDGNEYRKTT